MNPVWESEENRRRGLRLGFNYWMDKAITPTNLPGSQSQGVGFFQGLDVRPEELIDLIRSVLSSHAGQQGSAPGLPMPRFLDVDASRASMNPNHNGGGSIPHSVCVVALHGAGAVRLSDHLISPPSTCPPSLPPFLTTCSRIPIAYAQQADDAAAPSASNIRGASALLLWPQTLHLFGTNRDFLGFGTFADFLRAHTVHFQVISLVSTTCSLSASVYI